MKGEQLVGRYLKAEEWWIYIFDLYFLKCLLATGYRGWRGLLEDVAWESPAGVSSERRHQVQRVGIARLGQEGWHL